LKLFGRNNLDIMGYVIYLIPLYNDSFNLFFAEQKRKKGEER